ncbi:MAG TPA: hypothetical protein DDW73_24785 [Rhizobium sp.]|nr:hypothetical protein [Rhizobium sp.]
MPADSGIVINIPGCLFASRAFASIVALMIVFPLLYPVHAQAMGPDERGGPPGGGGGPPSGGGGPGMGGAPGGPPGQVGLSGGSVFGGARESGERRGSHFGGESSKPSRGREGGFRSGWNEEGFFDDSLPNMDHQKALAGVKSGRYRSLKEVIGIVGIPPSSRIVGMDLLNQNGVDVYSIIVRDASGHMERMTVDAETGARIN